MDQEANLDIAIVGMAGRFPGADNIDLYWQNLKEDKESITFFTEEDLLKVGVSQSLVSNPTYVKAAPILEDVKAFDEGFFGYSPREARMMDPQHRIFLEEAWHALEHAGYYAETVDGPISIFGGSAMNTYLLFTGLLPRFVDEYLPTLIGSDKDFLTTRVSYKLNLKGPSVTVQTACSTSLVAVHMACQSLLNGESDMALAGGVSVRVPHNAGHIYAQGSVFTPDGHCRPFDAGANGTIFGSGVGVVVLKRLEDALEDHDTVYAVIKGSAINNDGSSKADYTAPGIQPQADAITEALEVAGVDASSISYVEAHGTGTYLGDPIEIMALTRAFRSYTDKNGFCRIGSVKSNIGHLDAAAGMAGLIKTVLALKHREIPGTINFENPNPEINFEKTPFTVNDRLTPWDTDGGPRRAGVSSLGIGGTNAHVVLEEAPDIPQEPQPSSRQLLVFSARTPKALNKMSLQLGKFFSNNPVTTLQDAAYSLQVGRKTFEHRRFCVVESPEDAGAKLSPIDEASIYTSLDALPRQSVVFMCSGQGSQYVQMGRELYEKEQVFKEWVDRMATFIEPAMGLDLRELLYPTQKKEIEAVAQLNQTSLTQPALFVVTYALARQWMAWGIQPSALIGHSIGEYVAACLAGVFSWEDALTLVSERGRLMQSMPAGKMMAVQISAHEIDPYLTEGVELAAINSSSLCVVSGTEAAIDAAAQTLAAQDIKCRPLHTSHAFHSSMMDPVLDEFTSCFDLIQLKPPAIPFISNVSGTWITNEEATNPAYWAQHLRQPVRFQQGIAVLLEEEGRVFLEVGPGNTLSTFVRQLAASTLAASTEHQTVLSSLRHPNETVPDQQRLLEVLGRLWIHNINIDWKAVHGGNDRKRIGLPTYPFARNTHWFAAKEKKVLPQNAAATTYEAHDFSARKTDPKDWYYLPSWKRTTRLDVSIGSMKQHVSVLVFAAGTALDTLFIEQTKRLGHRVTTVSTGKEFREKGTDQFTIDPANKEDYVRLVEALEKNNLFPEYVAHFWCYSEETLAGSWADLDLDSAKTFAFYSQLHLARALSQYKQPGQVIRAGVFANCLFDVTGEDSLAPVKALLTGPSSVLPKELPFYESFVVDLPSSIGSEAPDTCRALLSDLSSVGTTSCIAYRGKHRWERHFEPVQLETSKLFNNGIEHLPFLRNNGVYLITGGLGGVGLAIARSLVERAAVKLVLVGRSKIPEREAWDTYIEDHGPQDPVSKKITAIRELEERGAEVLPCTADVADEVSLDELMDSVSQRFDKVDGVVHAAGVIEDAMALLKEDALIENVFAAKVTGTQNLGKVLQNVKPDFFLLCSSINVYVAPPGQIDYVAANQFLDHFAIQYTAETGINTQSVNWPGWTEVGMLARQQAGAGGQADWIKKALHRGITSEQGTNAFFQILNAKISNIIVSPVAFPYPSQIKKPANERVLVEGEDTKTNHASEKEAENENTAAGSIEAQLQNIWAEVLEVDRVDVHDNFFNLGGSSLLAITLFAEIEGRLGKLNLPLSSLLEAPTIAQFAELVRGRGIDSGIDSQKTPLVTIQKGNGVPLFCIHGAGGNVLIYQQLANQLGHRQTVYGFQASGLDGSQSILEDIESMASRYVEEVLRVCPDGPYFLLGYCMGGTIAWEMGQQLRKRGITDVSMILLETYNWENLKLDSVPGNLQYYAEKVYFHAKNYLLLDKQGRQRFLKEKTNVLKRRSRKWKGSLLNRVGISNKTGPGKLGVDEELLAKVWRTNDEAALVYRPEPYAGHVVHIRPRREYGRHSASGMGWETLAPDLETITMPVYPAGMLVQPFVSLLSNQIRKCIVERQLKERNRPNLQPQEGQDTLGSDVRNPVPRA